MYWSFNKQMSEAHIYAKTETKDIRKRVKKLVTDEQKKMFDDAVQKHTKQ